MVYKIMICFVNRIQCYDVTKEKHLILFGLTYYVHVGNVNINNMIPSKFNNGHNLHRVHMLLKMKKIQSCFRGINLDCGVIVLKNNSFKQTKNPLRS